jgi:hypothetical protein
MKKILIIFSFVFCAVCLCFSLSNCSGNIAENKQHRVLDSSTYASAEPSDFNGPWAADIAREVAQDKSDYVYDILKDSKITDQEFQETKTKFEQCVKGYGYNVRFGDANILGGYIIVVPGYVTGKGGGDTEKAQEADSKCSNTGYMGIAALYYKMLWNPQKEDLSAYSAQCLVKLGYEQQSYSGEDYKNMWGDSGLIGGIGGENEIPGANAFKAQAASKTAPVTNRIPMSDFNKCAYNPKLILAEK